MSTARGAVLGVATVVAERAVALGVVLVLARVLTPDDFGRYGYLLAGIALVQVMADQGLEVAAVARMAGAPTSTPAVVASVLRARALLWLLGALPVGALVLPALAARGQAPSLAAGVGASLIVLLGSSITVRGVCRARSDMREMARVALADALLGATALVATAAAGGGLGALFAARVLASMVVTTVALAAESRRHPGGVRGPDPGRALFRAAAPLAGSALLVALQTRSGHLAAMAFAGAEVVAMLAAAARLCEVLGVIPEGVLLAVFPRMAAQPERAAALAGETARRIAVVVLAVVCVLVVGGSSIAARLFGPAYHAAGPAIAVLAWGALLSVTGGMILHAAAALGRQRSLVGANLAGAVVGIGLQLVLIPRLGLVGAALGTVAAAVCGQLVLGLLTETRSIVAAVWRRALPPALLAVLVAGGVAAWRDDLPAAVGAALAYLLAARALGLVAAGDWRAMLAEMRRAWRG